MRLAARCASGCFASLPTKEQETNEQSTAIVRQARTRDVVVLVAADRETGQRGRADTQDVALRRADPVAILVGIAHREGRD